MQRKTDQQRKNEKKKRKKRSPSYAKRIPSALSVTAGGRKKKRKGKRDKEQINSWIQTVIYHKKATKTELQCINEQQKTLVSPRRKTSQMQRRIKVLFSRRENQLREDKHS